ncbi:hypothetical protein B0A55_08682 [Friedmanniomyces simplex]|uniref:Uncharacterized protein n=1 Tax=Friedmanniomyces simplex TaxID=329884 RepID=A0A4U0X1B8_9PEZI|nr:hypothetical protein B0A55_08682 [Friedmanniomyces simplex]
MLGATAGAAIAWAMFKSEGNNARDEAAYAASSRSRSATRQASNIEGLQRNYSTTESHASNKHRNFSVTESAYSRKYPPRSLARSMGQARRTIEPAPYYNANEVEEAISRYTSSRRPAPPRRSKTIDAVDYAPISRAGRESHYTAKRSATMPFDEPAAYPEAPKSTRSTTRHTIASRRGTAQPIVDEDEEPLEPLPRDTTSHYTTTSRRSPRQSVREEDQYLKRRDSGISMGSHRSQHSHRSRRSTMANDQGSSASTLKPSRRGSDAAAAVPLPASKAPSRASTTRRPPPPPPQSRAQSYVTAAQVPIPESHHGAGYAAESAEDSDGLGDARTVIPDDSISCVDFSKPRSSARSSHKSSKHESRRSETAGSDRTVRPARDHGSSRHSAATLPARAREEHYSSNGKKRSTASYA